MIFELFLGFIFLALAMIVIGYYTDIKVLAILGFTTIFILGLTINLSGLTIKTGETIAYEYGVNSTILNTVSTYVYTPLVDQASLWIGRWLMIVSVLGAALVFTSNKKVKD